MTAIPKRPQPDTAVSVGKVVASETDGAMVARKVTSRISASGDFDHGPYPKESFRHFIDCQESVVGPVSGTGMVVKPEARSVVAPKEPPRTPALPTSGRGPTGLEQCEGLFLHSSKRTTQRSHEKKKPELGGSNKSTGQKLSSLYCGRKCSMTACKRSGRSEEKLTLANL